MAENNSIGALWQKSGKKGTWFSGGIELNGVKTQIVVFKNDFKKEEKHPDYKIFVSDASKKGQSTQPESSLSELESHDPENSDDLPF